MSFPPRNIVFPVVCLLAVIVRVSIGVGVAAAQNNESQPAAPADRPSAPPPLTRDAPLATAPNANSTKPADRIREGTRLVDEIGTFQNVGDRVAFLPGGDKDSYRVLENLMLQRIGTALDDVRGPRQWIVSGIITEYKGANYLLVTKAVIRSQDGDSAAAR